MDVMEHLLSEVRRLFGVGPIPDENGLVRWDGLNQFEKESAVRFYFGMTWMDVLQHLQDGGAHALEEWSVLDEMALQYYGRAYFEFLFKTAYCPVPDEDFVSQLFHQLYQLVYMNNGSPFSADQTTVIVNIANVMPVFAVEHGVLSLQNEYITRNITLYLNELRRYR